MRRGGRKMPSDAIASRAEQAVGLDYASLADLRFQQRTEGLMAYTPSYDT